MLSPNKTIFLSANGLLSNTDAENFPVAFKSPSLPILKPSPIFTPPSVSALAIGKV